jgi:two-component system, LytTR family, response regulator
MSIKTVVVDDERPARTRIIELLERQSDVELVGTASNGREALDVIRKTWPDLLFLDVQMPYIDGLGLMERLPREKLPATIFVTAFDQYARLAFDAHAVDYLRKPFSDQRFEDSIRRARRYLHGGGDPDMGDSHDDEDLPDANVVPRYLDRIALKSDGCVDFVELRDIDWIEAAGVYIYLHQGTRRHILRSSMVQLLQRLDPRQFVRIHRSAAVNTDRIHQLRRLSHHGDFTLILKDGRELTLSRAYRPKVEAWLGQRL